MPPVAGKDFLGKFVFCLVVAVLLSGCGGQRNLGVTDVTKAETVVLRKQAGQGPIHSIAITGHGEIQGNAEIALFLNGTPNKTASLSGLIDFRWEGDWYSDQAEIQYAPASVTRGRLGLKYEFRDERKSVKILEQNC